MTQPGHNECGNQTIVDVECLTMTGHDFNLVKENTVCDASTGVYCRNRDLNDISCSDYKYRLKCSSEVKRGKSAFFMLIAYSKNMENT